MSWPGWFGKSRVVDGVEGRMTDERLRDGLRVRGVPVHAHREGLDPARSEPGVKRPADRAGPELDEADLLGEFVVVQDHRTTEHVGMTTEVFGGRVHDDVRAERERLLQVRRRERVVNDNEGAGPVTDLDESRDVADLHERVTGGLDPQHLRRGLVDGTAHGAQIAHVDRGEGDAPRNKDAVDETVGSAVDVVAHHDTVAWRKDRAQQGILGCKTRREAERVRTALERGQLQLQRGACRVTTARVLVAAAETADAILDEGRREVDGRHDRAGGWIEFLPRMNGAGGEALRGGLKVVGHVVSLRLSCGEFGLW